MTDEPRECGEPLNDGSGRVCRKVVHPKLGFHGGGHMFAPPDMTEEQLREGLMSLVRGPSPEDALARLDDYEATNDPTGGSHADR